METYIRKNVFKPSGENFTEQEIKHFMKGADPYLIAFGEVNNYTVVTQERDKKGKIKIPAICKDFKVNCLDIFDVL